MKIDILTLFPEMFCGPFDYSIVKRAKEKGLVEVKIHNLRDWAIDKRGTVDDRPYGGGAGMILMVEPIDRALRDLKCRIKNEKCKIILLTPQGKTFNQKIARQFSKLDRLILICGHYEGVDERIRKHLVDGEISIGDYVLTGGEIPAMVITDTIIRLIPGVLKKEDATQLESFSGEKPLLEYPQYTRPEKYKDWKVPEVLLSGNHKEINLWRERESFKKTKKTRPDLLKT